MPNLLYDAQQTRYGQLVTNSLSNNNYISSDFTKKLWCETYLIRTTSIPMSAPSFFHMTTRVTI